ncbi:MAG: hypothetical protein R3229_03105 [Alphaproteobacteria bacterium]|nr:hypothetical protein [Alphaproteobacteria bacterium]
MSLGRGRACAAAATAAGADEDPNGVIRDPAVNDRVVIEVSSGQCRVAKQLAENSTAEN